MSQGDRVKAIFVTLNEATSNEKEEEFEKIFKRSTRTKFRKLKSRYEKCKRENKLLKIKLSQQGKTGTLEKSKPKRKSVKRRSPEERESDPPVEKRARVFIHKHRDKQSKLNKKDGQNNLIDIIAKGPSL